MPKRVDVGGPRAKKFAELILFASPECIMGSFKNYVNMKGLAEFQLYLIRIVKMVRDKGEQGKIWNIKRSL